MWVAQWLLVACTVAAPAVPRSARAAQLAWTPRSDDRPTTAPPPEEQVEDPMQDNKYGPRGFRFSYPLHEFGSPFYSRDQYFNDYRRSLHVPRYDSGLFDKPAKVHLTREYGGKGCSVNNGGKDTTSLPGEPNFHQRFDPGPDGFGPFGRRPQPVDTDFYYRRRAESGGAAPDIIEDETLPGRHRDTQRPRGLHERENPFSTQSRDFGIFSSTRSSERAGPRPHDKQQELGQINMQTPGVASLATHTLNLHSRT